MTVAATSNLSKLVDSKDLNAIYSSRVIALLSSDQEIDVKKSFPMSLHLSQPQCPCRMECGFVKPNPVKRLLQVELYRMNASDVNITVIDGSALLWTIHWPANSTAADVIVNAKNR